MNPAQSTPRMLYTCATRGCAEAGRGFCDEPTFCSVCMQDLAGVYDMTGTLRAGVVSGGSR